MSTNERKTVELEKVPEWAIKIQEGVNATRGEVASLRTDVQLLGESHKDLSQRMTISERRHAEFEEWRSRSSERAKAEESARSKTDMDHSAQLVHLTDEMHKATANQTAVILEKMAATPQGQRLINAMVGFLVIVLTVAGGWLLMHGGTR